MAQAAGRGEQSAIVGIPVTIEDEVQPAYARYDDCLKAQVSETRVTAETFMAKFREAMTTCGRVRELAVAEATRALIAKGWDEATRARAAASTFAKVDESWLTMGRQYQQVLLQKAAQGAAKAVVAQPAAKRKRIH